MRAIKYILGAIMHLWNTIFASRDWDLVGNPDGSWSMRRWKDGAWEVREATPEEIEEGPWWWW